jgi:hypothetical protein
VKKFNYIVAKAFTTVADPNRKGRMQKTGLELGTVVHGIIFGSTKIDAKSFALFDANTVKEMVQELNAMPQREAMQEIHRFRMYPIEYLYDIQQVLVEVKPKTQAGQTVRRPNVIFKA